MTLEIAATRAGGRAWVGLAVLTLPCLLVSMDLTVLYLAVPHLTADLKPSAAQLLWIVDIYGFLIAGSLDHHGDSWRPDRAAPAAADRRGGFRSGIGAGGVLHQRGDADRDAGRARRRRRDADALDPVADPQHVPRRCPAHLRDRDLDHQLLDRRHHRPADRRRAARAFLVGLGVPDRRSRDGAAAGGGAAAAAGVSQSASRPLRSAQRASCR